MELALIGCGKWGRNYVKTALQLPHIKIHITNRENWREISKKCQGAIIATPPDSHIDIALELLDHDLPLMIEKPLSLNLQEVFKLQNFNIPILVNHLHLFSPAFEAIQERVSSPIIHISSVGANQSLPRNYSTLFDYGCHDLSMGISLTQPEVIQLTSISGKSKDLCKNLFSCQLRYDLTPHSLVVGNQINAKSRYLCVKTQTETFIYNDLMSDKLRVNNSIVEISKKSPLLQSLNCFVSAIEGKNDKRMGVNLSLRVIDTLEKLQNRFLSQSNT